MGESEYIQEQTDDAKAAIGATLGELEREVGHAVDPRAWARAHPWISLAVAAAAGFAASELLARSDTEPEPIKHHPEPGNGHPPRRWSRAIPILAKTLSMAWTVLSNLLEAQKVHSHPDEPPRQPR
jgi:hypothetical protein